MSDPRAIFAPTKETLSLLHALMIPYNQTEVKKDEVPPMEKTMASALNALKEQVKVGFSPKSDSVTLLGGRTAIDRPARIGDLLQDAEAARDDLRHAGCRR